MVPDDQWSLDRDPQAATGAVNDPGIPRRSLVVGVGLMALVFYSSRKGYDEPVVLIQEPEGDPDDGQGAPR